MKKNKLNKKLHIGMIILTVIALLTLLGIICSPYDPEQMNAAMKLKPASFLHPFGTDQFGRDIFSRALAGIKTTIFVAAGTNFIGAFLGLLIGALTGYYGGIVDEILMRINDAALAFPSILLALVVIAVMGNGPYQLMLSMGIVFVPSYARIIRSEFMTNRNKDYVKAAKLYGSSDIRVIFRQILPNIGHTYLNTLVIGFNNAVLCEAAMSFLGLGLQPPDTSLGLMLSDAQAYLFVRPGYAFFTGALMVMLILGFALLNDGLKESQYA